MSNNSTDPELSVFETVDFRAFFETLKLRWWVIPAVVLASIGFLQAQESDLRTEPATVIVSRGYETNDPGRSLAALGINVSLSEFPELQTQLLILKSIEVRDEITKTLGKEVEVRLPENWETPVTFSCNQPVQSDCERAIDAYVTKAIEIREAAVATGISNTKAVLTRLQETAPAPDNLQRIAALDALSENLDISFELVDGFEQSIGPTVTQVRRPTYVMGAAAGLLIALLILLQLTYSDSRVRSVRQLVRVVGSRNFLGRVTAKTHPVRDRRTAVGIHQGLSNASAARVRFVPLRTLPTDDATLARLAQMSGTSHGVTKPFAELSIPELADPTPAEVDVIVVQRNRDLHKDVSEALTALQRTNRVLVGVLLLN
jgi:hypothetical protein